MRIGKPEGDEKGFVRFEDIGIGCCFREYDDWNSDEPIYMKTNCFSVDIGRDRNVGYNAVNLENGLLEFVENDTTVMIANVHIEND